MNVSLFRTILVPHDFSSNATAALTIAAGLAAQHRGRLLVVHAIAPIYQGTWIGAPGELSTWVPPPKLVAETRQRLETLVARTVRAGRVRSVKCRVLVGDAHRCIIEAARKADSIVMATLGRTASPPDRERGGESCPARTGPVLTVRSARRTYRRDGETRALEKSSATAPDSGERLIPAIRRAIHYEPAGSSRHARRHRSRRHSGDAEALPAAVVRHEPNSKVLTTCIFIGVPFDCSPDSSSLSLPKI
jgi:nucleotide-binding universal stress UspA family protein